MDRGDKIGVAVLTTSFGFFMIGERNGAVNFGDWNLRDAMAGRFDVGTGISLVFGLFLIGRSSSLESEAGIGTDFNG